MERRDKMIGGLDIGSLVGIEIGALAFPIVSKLDGDITYVDFTDTQSLRDKYKNSESVPIDNIVEVDAIWGSDTLKQSIGGRLVDYVIASHVIEHVPDLLGWLGECRSVLKPAGEIRLAIPDKRYCFDYLRRETEAVDVLAAHLSGARIPSPRQIIDFVLNYTEVDKAKAWNGLLQPSSLICQTSIKSAIDLAKKSLDGEYIDVHCWVFTPKSPGELFGKLARAELIDLECVSFHNTAYGEHEFFISLRPCANFDQVVRSWDYLRDCAINSKVNNNQTKFDGKIVHQPSRNRGKDDGWYLVKNGKRSWIVDGAWLAKNGFKENEVIEISSDEFNAIPECSNPLY